MQQFSSEAETQLSDISRLRGAEELPYQLLMQRAQASSAAPRKMQLPLTGAKKYPLKTCPYWQLRSILDYSSAVTPVSRSLAWDELEFTAVRNELTLKGDRLRRSYREYLKPVPEMQLLMVVAALLGRAAVLEGCFAANLHMIQFKVELWTLHLTPSTLTETFEGFLLNPEPVMVRSWPYGAPYLALKDDTAGRTRWSQFSLVRDALCVRQFLIAFPRVTFYETLYLPASCYLACKHLILPQSPTLSWSCTMSNRPHCSNPVLMEMMSPVLRSPSPTLLIR